VSEAVTTRRGLLAGGASVAGLTGMLALAGCGGSGAAQTTTTPRVAGDVGPGDAGILNYVLVLEYIEADFYDRVVTAGALRGQALEFAKTFGDEQQQHVDTLTASVQKLGGTVAARPATRFTLGAPAAVLTLAATIENAGAAAYLAQLPRIRSRALLATALTIHSVEARHAATMDILRGGHATNGPLATPRSAARVLRAVRPFIAS
jgi:hypothetical protein